MDPNTQTHSNVSVYVCVCVFVLGWMVMGVLEGVKSILLSTVISKTPYLSTVG